MAAQSSRWNVAALVGAGVVAVAGLWWLAEGVDEEPRDVAEETATEIANEVVGEATGEPRVPEGPADEVVDRSLEVAEAVDRHSRRRQKPPEPWSGDRIVDELEDVEPRQWGEFVDGVIRRFETDDRRAALTLDACDYGYDAELIEELRDREIPATLFVSGYFVDAHPELLQRLDDDPLFEIANHGLKHRPCSVSGKSAADIEGTADVREAHREIEANARDIEQLTGERPRYYRSGTAHYDEVCTRIAGKAGHRVVGFDVVGDLGAMYDTEEIEEALDGVESGSIAVLHMNEPDGDSAEGLRRALPRLKDRGYRFVRLSEVLD